MQWGQNEEGEPEESLEQSWGLGAGEGLRGEKATSGNAGVGDLQRGTSVNEEETRSTGGQEDKGPGRERGWESMEGTGSENGESPSQDGISAARVPRDAGHRRSAWVRDGDIRGETHQTEVFPYPSPKFCQR